MKSSVLKVKELEIKFPKELKYDICRGFSDVLDSGMLVASKYAKLVEDEMVKITKAKYAIACSSGGSALEMAFKYQKVHPYFSDKRSVVLVPTNTFAATALAAERAGFKVKYVDMEPEYFGMNLEKAKELIRADSKYKKEIAGVAVVHVGGYINPSVQTFVEWCKTFGVWTIEDAAHAIGSRLEDGHAGTFGFAGCFSFFATKTVGSAEGGAIVTQSKGLVDFCIAEMNYGKPEAWKHHIVQKGWNNRISEFSAVVIYNLLLKLPTILKDREKLVEIYYEMLSQNFDIVLPHALQKKHSWYKFIVVTPRPAKLYYEKLEKMGYKMAGTVFDPPLHKMKVLKIRGKFPVADHFCPRHICVPIYPSLTKKQVVEVCEAIIKVDNQLK